MKKTFNTFNDIQHHPLRIFNRSVMAHNILEDQGKETMSEYLSLFTDEERVEMYKMTALVKKIGSKKLRELVTEGLVFSNEEHVGV